MRLDPNVPHGLVARAGATPTTPVRTRAKKKRKTKAMWRNCSISMGQNCLMGGAEGGGALVAKELAFGEIRPDGTGVVHRGRPADPPTAG